MSRQAPTISQIFGGDGATAQRETANNLADHMLAHHWHVDKLPWDSLPAFPIRADAPRERTLRLARFYKSVVTVQTRAEEIAASIARRLLIYANEEKLDLSFRRAIASLLNDESSHVATILKLEALADATYPDVNPRGDESPLFSALMPAIEDLEPSVLAIFMSSYEASVAIRSYAEEQTYRLPSILGSMAPRAAEDDGRHAKTLRILAHEFLRIFRSRNGDDDLGRSPVWREKILDPFTRFWTLMPAHEFYLAGNDRRQLRNVRKVVAHDVAIMKMVLDYVGVSPEAQAYMQVETIADLLPQ